MFCEGFGIGYGKGGREKGVSLIAEGEEKSQRSGFRTLGRALGRSMCKVGSKPMEVAPDRRFRIEIGN